MMVWQSTKHKLGKLVKQGKKATYPQLLPHLLKSRANTFAPLLGAGVRLELLDLDNGLCVVHLPLTKLNKGFDGNHFGGNLYMMADPFLMMLLSHKLGKDYHISELSSQIQFIKASQDKAIARIKIDNEELKIITAHCQNNPSIERSYQVVISDTHQKPIAIINKTFLIKKQTPK